MYYDIMYVPVTNWYETSSLWETRFRASISGEKNLMETSVSADMNLGTAWEPLYGSDQSRSAISM